ncbi:DUF7500 family protein [Halobaculum lipolyticum]|uniref:Uncharacterized protein n=1 Tax=Halobaculum lipolyticum TaxID=3032001 RepID=A0ABD5WDD1_9EURY|nr:hypothetical protein [Halobaculum sp. DT31]
MSDDAPRGNPGVDPDDLDISKSEYVRELGDDRYVVSAGNRPPRAPREDDTDETDEGAADAAADAGDAGDAGDAAATRDHAADVATTAEAVREGLSPEDGPGAAGDAGDATSDPPHSSAAGAATSADPAATEPGATDPVASDPNTAAGTASDSGATRSSTSSPQAAGDEGLPGASGEPTGADAPSSADTGARPASHGRRGAPLAGGGDADPGDLDADAVGQWLAASLANTEFTYGFDATLSLGDRTTRHRMVSDDLGEAFETLVTWFADTAGGDTATEDALGILLAGMDTGPRLSPADVRSAMAGLGVSRDDTVEDLLVALDRAGGLEL